MLVNTRNRNSDRPSEFELSFTYKDPPSFEDLVDELDKVVTTMSDFELDNHGKQTCIYTMKTRQTVDYYADPVESRPRDVKPLTGGGPQITRLLNEIAFPKTHEDGKCVETLHIHLLVTVSSKKAIPGADSQDDASHDMSHDMASKDAIPECSNHGFCGEDEREGVVGKCLCFYLAHTITQRQTQNRLQEAQQAERTLAELGTMFTKMTSLISQQGEVLEKVEDDVEAGLQEIIGGENEIQNLYAIRKGNRGLIIKLFSLLIFFIIFMRFYAR